MNTTDKGLARVKSIRFSLYASHLAAVLNSQARQLEVFAERSFLLAGIVAFPLLKREPFLARPFSSSEGGCGGGERFLTTIFVVRVDGSDTGG